MPAGIFGLSGLTCGDKADAQRGVDRVGTQEHCLPSPTKGHLQRLVLACLGAEQRLYPVLLPILFL